MNSLILQTDERKIFSVGHYPHCGRLSGDGATFQSPLLLVSNPSSIIPVSNPNKNSLFHQIHSLLWAVVGSLSGGE